MAPTNLHTTHTQEVFNWVWDPGTSEWVKETQPGGGGGGGADVQYVQDDAAVANPTGTALAVVRADSLVPLTSADGDIVAARGTNFGEVYVRDYDAVVALQSINSQTSDVVSFTGSLNTKTPALGQATMANSSPVVLASDQTTLPVSLPAQSLLTHTFTTSGATFDVAIGGASVAVVTFTGSAGIGSPTVGFKGSVDGSTFQTLAGTRDQSGAASTVTGFNTTTDSFSTIFFVLPVEGLQTIRFTSGSTFSSSTVNMQVGLSQGHIHRTFVEARQGSPNTAVANAWFTRLVDGGGSSVVAVKAASTAAAATDPALVVRSIQLPAAVGQTTMAASLSVALASDQSALGVTGPLTDTQLRAAAVPVTANAGTNLNTSALALDATLTGRTAKAQITDGTRDGTVKAASTLPALTDTAVVTTQRDPLPAGTNVIGHVIADSGSTTAVTGTVTTDLSKVAGTATDTNSGTKSAGTLRVVLATDQPALTNKLLVTPDSVALPANQSVDVNQLAGTATDTNSGTKSAGTLRVVLATDQPALTNKLLVTPDSVALPANQSVNVAQYAGTNASTGTGASGAGIPRVTVANDSNVIVTPPTLTKGTQSATGFSTQDLKDSGRNQTNYFMAAPVACTTAEVMQSMTGYKGGIAVGATVTPAVVTSGKTYRIDKIKVTIIALTAIGSARINLRANLSGSGVVGSPLVMSYQVGIPAIFTAGSAETYSFDYSEGMEFPAGTGLAIGVIGEGADGTTGTAVAKVMVSLHGYEY